MSDVCWFVYTEFKLKAKYNTCEQIFKKSKWTPCFDKYNLYYKI